MKLATLIAATALCAAAFAEETCAKPESADARPPKPPAGERMRPMGPGMQDPLLRAAMNPRFAEKLGLTDEQKAKLGNIEALRAQSRELNTKARKATERQMELLRADQIDEAAVMAAIDETFEARKALAKEQTKRLITVKSVLTPEQIAKARELIKEGGFRGPKGERKGQRGPKPPKHDDADEGKSGEDK